MNGAKVRPMNVIPLDLWVHLSVAASCLLVLGAAIWVLRQAFRIPATAKDGRNVRAIAALASLGMLAWLVYAVFKGYANFWQADALIVMAQGPSLVQIPLITGGIAWVAALLLGRMIRMHGMGER